MLKGSYRLADSYLSSRVASLSTLQVTVAAMATAPLPRRRLT
jgi:hypothetical protein